MIASKRRIRFSIIDYLNALPLNLAFKDGLFAERAKLMFDFPSMCADHLATDQADVGLISSIEYQRIPDLVVAPGVCIASQREVKSVLLITSKLPGEIRTVALDRFSRSSVALLRILFHRRYGVRPKFITMMPDPKAMLAEADAALVIGDAALRLAPGAYQAIDLASEWFAETGLPFVFAFWAMRRHAPQTEIAQMVFRAKEYGMANFPARIEDIQKRWPLSQSEILAYFTHHIHYDLGEREHESLARFFTYAAEAGLISQCRPLVLAPAG